MSGKNDGVMADPPEEVSITKGLEDMKLILDDERRVFEATKNALRKYGALIVPSLLVARLFLAYAADSTSSTSVENRHGNQDEGASSDKTSPVTTSSDIKDSPGATVNAREMSQGGSEQKLPPRGSSTATAKRRRNLTITKSKEQYMVHIASDLAILLARVKREDTTRLGILPEQVKTPTVAEIASRCLALVSTSTERDTGESDLCVSLCNEFIDHDELFSTIVGHALDFKVFLLKALKHIQKASIVAMEAHYDFEYLWFSCTADETYCRSLTGISTDASQQKRLQQESAGMQRDRRLLMECAWRMSCLSTPSDDKDEASTLLHRRKRIVTDSACLALLSFLSEYFYNRRRMLEKEDCLPDSTSLTGESTEGPVGPPMRPPEEADAIDALRMISGRNDTQTIEGNALVDYGTLTEHATLLVTQTSYRLQSLLEDSTQPENQQLQETRLWREQVEKEIESLAKRLVSMFLPNKNTDMKKTRHGSVLSSVKAILATMDGAVDFTDAESITRKLATVLTQATDRTVMPELEKLDTFPFVDRAYLTDFQPPNMADLCRKDQSAGSPVSGFVVHNSASNEAASALLSVSKVPGRDLTDAMELNEWTVTVLSITLCKPSTRLLLYLNASGGSKKRRRPGNSGRNIEPKTWKSVLVPTLRLALQRLACHVTGTPINESSGLTQQIPKVEIDSETGKVTFSNQSAESESLFLRAVMVVFYHALESVLFQETSRLKSASHPSLVLNESFHLALVSCCYVSMLKAVQCNSSLVLSDKSKRLDFLVILQVLNISPYTFLKVSEAFCRALKGDTRGPSLVLHGFPRLLQKRLSECEVSLIDSTIWSDEAARSSSSVRRVIDGLKNPIHTYGESSHPMSWPPSVLCPLPEERDGETEMPIQDIRRQSPDEHFFAYLLRKLLRMSFFRIASLCKALKIPSQHPVCTQAWFAFRYLLRNNIEILFNRHVDQLLLCCLYGVGKMMRYEPELSFSQIVEIYTEVRGHDLGERSCHMIARVARLVSQSQDSLVAEDQTVPKYGNVIVLYNHVFVPAMRKHLLESKSLREATNEFHRMLAGQENAAQDKSDTPSITRGVSIAERAGVIVRQFPDDMEIKEGNVTLHLCHPESSAATRAVTKPNGTAPLYRAFYRFGEASIQDLDRVNDMIAKRTPSSSQLLQI